MTNCDKRCHYIALIVSMLVTLFSVLPSQALLAQSEPLGLGEEGQLYQLDDARLPPGTPEQMQMALLATGDYRIDALNSGYRWPASWTQVTYSFYDNETFGGSYYGSEVVSETSEAVKANVREIMAWYSTVMNINFVEVTETPTVIGYCCW